MTALWLAGFIWLLTAGLALVRTHLAARALYRLQALTEAALVLSLGTARLQDTALLLGVLVILVTKVAVVPAILRRADHGRPDAYGSRGPMGITALLGGMGVLTVFAVTLLHDAGIATLSAGLLFGAWFVALLHLTSRYELWSLAWGLLSLETVSDAVVVTLGQRLPLAADLLVTLSSAAIALLLSLLVARIVHLKDGTDVRTLEELVG
jgi:hydrogenase-4 membrane subunit HyfE